MAHTKVDIGQRYGRLVVVSRDLDKQQEYYNSTGRYVAFWNCKCDCGNDILVRSNNLLSGNTLSCGCLRNDRIRVSKNTRKNTWECKDNTIIGTTIAGVQFLIDKEDYEKVKDFCWRVNKYGYVVAFDKGHPNNQIVRIYRLVMGLTREDGDVYIDHINGNKLDNRKSNLRIATKSENNTNIKRKSNNTSGYTGVKSTKGGKYVAQISFNNKRIHLGTYSTIEEAVQARHDAEIKYHGEWNGELNRNDYGNFRTNLARRNDNE